MVCESLPFDVIAYKDRVSTRIQCKYSSNGHVPAETSWSDTKGCHKKKYKDENPDLYRILANIRRRRYRHATPAWLTKEQRNAIKQLYIEARKLTKLTGVKYEVDHIVPLINDDVCGLHVPWNLQVLTKDENLRKSNKISCTPIT